jgi:uncharacterized phage-associated protein
MNSGEKRERLLSVATALLAQAPRQEMKVVNLNQALFYLDLVALRDLGETLTDNTYIALKQGPVVAKYQQRLIQELEKGEYAVQGKSTNDLSRPLRLKRLFNPAYRFPKRLRDQVTKIVAWACSKSAKGVSDFSHQNPGWRFSYQEGLGAHAQPKPINMHLALQQILDDDPWLSELFSEKELEAFAHFDHCRGEPW